MNLAGVMIVFPDVSRRHLCKVFPIPLARDNGRQRELDTDRDKDRSLYDPRTPIMPELRGWARLSSRTLYSRKDELCANVIAGQQGEKIEAESKELSVTLPISCQSVQERQVPRSRSWGMPVLTTGEVYIKIKRRFPGITLRVLHKALDSPMNSSSETSKRMGDAFGATFDEIHGSTYLERDAHGLARLGKSQVLKRRFGFLSVFGFSCCILATWETALALFTEAFHNGGPAALAWGFLIAWLSSFSVYLCLAEMASIIFTGTIIQGLIILNYPDYEPQNFHGALLAWAVIAVCIFVNTVVAGLLPVLEGLILLIHVLGFIAILIALVYLSPHSSAEDVFFRPLNEGNWPSQGLSYLIGFIGNVATFVGADAAVHNSPTGFPFIQVFYNGVGRAGATVMTVVIIVIIWCAVIGFAATASRMTWSFARDRGLPFHRFIRKVHPRTRVPVVAIAVVTLIPCLLNLIYIGSSTAFNDVISMSVSGLYASYLIPCSFLLWRRVTGQIKPHRVREDPGIEIRLGRDRDPDMPSQLSVEGNGDSDILFEEQVLEWGPWRVPGLLGILNNTFACVFCVWVLFWDFWPPNTPVTAENMNYSVLVTGSVILFAVARYFLGAKVEYRGPLVDYEVKSFAIGPS
ncbi:hypothetical protein FHL15_009135 [Xylaria flabelliformis]|uniref:Amino acid permease/ SLC12A domain-containing protein n=1 Tax=Xylaria flabelliformis TaxID=2512241 RepID=A0A553HQ03_9PEZI|nr:hypothetical protein FHL15_009135 [Xylaria flabelliformis]